MVAHREGREGGLLEAVWVVEGGLAKAWSFAVRRRARGRPVRGWLVGLAAPDVWFVGKGETRPRCLGTGRVPWGVWVFHTGTESRYGDGRGPCRG